MEEVFGMDTRALQELHRQREFMDSPQYNQPMKKLVDAFKTVERGRVTVGNAPGVYRVQGSKGNEYFVNTNGCNCPNGLHSTKTKYGCYHSVAVELYKRWQVAMQPMLALPLPPMTIDERLAAPVPPQATIPSVGISAAAPAPEPLLEAPGAQERAVLHWHFHDCTVCETGWRCQQTPCAAEPTRTCPQCVAHLPHTQTIALTPTTKETAMAAPRDAEYIPEPETADAAPAPRVVMPTVVPQEVAGTALVRRPETTLAAVALEASLEEWGKQRKVITKYIREHFVEGTDYYTIKVGGRDTKPTLGKPGSEKFLSLFQLQALFRKDEDTWDMLGRPQGLLCYICTLYTRSGEVLGEGRGCRDLKKDGGDVNKAVKMAQKSAQIDAILRTGALSDAFTQDLEETAPEPPPAAPVAAAEDDRRAIAYYLRKLYGMGGASKEAYETAVLKATGYPLVPEHYRAIVRKLRALMDEAEAALDDSAR